MARNTNIKLRRSATQGSIPTTSNLDLGELAINTYDGKLYVRKTFGSLDRVVQVGSSSYNYNLATGVTETLTVTVASSTSDHRYNGTGSSSKYFINGLPSPYLNLVPGVTYRFDVSDSSNSGHPFRFYYEADKTTAYTTGVTTSGTAGNSSAYVEILATDATPPVLHYQCSAHANMGNQASFATRNFTGFDTDDLSEGSTNLYYTDARAQAVSINNIVEDTPPQLGGTLDTNNQLIQFGDSSGATVNRLQLGASQDLQIYHDGSNSIIADTGTGDLFLAGTQLRLTNGGRTATYLQGTDGGAVDIRYNNSTKLETTSGGISVTGNIALTGDIQKTGQITLDATGNIALDADGGSILF